MAATGGGEYERGIDLIGVELVTSDKHKLGQRPPAEGAKACVGLVI